jgi:ATP diphosphatase
VALPALKRAEKLGQRASAQGFDWPDTSGVKAKIAEELAELEQAVSSGSSDRMEDELGDVFFAVVNLARHLKLDPEQALTRANRKFEDRYREMEKTLQAQGIAFDGLSIDELEEAWSAAKNRLSS